MARFYLDHNVPRRIAILLRTAGHAAMTTRELRGEANDDDKQLLTAALSGRNLSNVSNEEIRRMFNPADGSILLTHDDDFLRIHRNWAHRSAILQLIASHTGILLLPAFPIWSAERAAAEIEALLQRQLPLHGELYEWMSGTWMRR